MQRAYIHVSFQFVGMAIAMATTTAIWMIGAAGRRCTGIVGLAVTPMI
jgi:hypothetical protein